jgi:hypothetical protein
MNHIVLLGDSIFDNRAWILPNELAVIEQLQELLPQSWKASLLAVDGSPTSGVILQCQRIPSDATHLIISVGGNDALPYLGILSDSAGSVAEILHRFSSIQWEFEGKYLEMLDTILKCELPTALCTIYYPDYPEEDFQNLAVTALSTFNDCIIRAAITHGLPLLDLRLICNDPSDYANPIEPSAAGGAKIANVIKRVIDEHDFLQGKTVVYF